MFLFTYQKNILYILFILYYIYIFNIYNIMVTARVGNGFQNVQQIEAGGERA